MIYGMSMDHFYHNKTILITGAASGIGKHFAQKVSDYSPGLLILWDLNIDELQKLKSSIGDKVKVHHVNIDISDQQIVFLESENLVKQGHVPDIIINCAGIVIGKMFHEHRLDEISKTININTAGSMFVARAFLNEMMERGSGQIVNLASASGYIGNPKMSVYAASKWAVLGWSESLRLEMENLKTGIIITTVIPSYIDTGMFKGVKAPTLVPLLKTETIVNKMLTGIAKGKSEIKAPFMVRFVPLLKALLPATLFDWLAGSVLGVYRSMDSFEGRKK